MQLKNIPTDTLIHNVEMKPGKGGQLNRSAGTYSQLIGKDAEYAQIKLSSGEIKNGENRMSCNYWNGFKSR